MDPNNTEYKRNTDGTFTKGTAPGPGRKPGQTLKEFWKNKFMQMSDEEKEEFSKKVGIETIWKMAEGMPKQDVEGEIKGTINVNLVKYGDNDSTPIQTS